jgi:hypothetical protein
VKRWQHTFSAQTRSVKLFAWQTPVLSNARFHKPMFHTRYMPPYSQYLQLLRQLCLLMNSPIDAVTRSSTSPHARDAKERHVRCSTSFSVVPFEQEELPHDIVDVLVMDTTSIVRIIRSKCKAKARSVVNLPPSLRFSSISSSCCTAVLTLMYRGGSYTFFPLASASKQGSFTRISLQLKGTSVSLLHLPVNMPPRNRNTELDNLIPRNVMHNKILRLDVCAYQTSVNRTVYSPVNLSRQTSSISRICTGKNILITRTQRSLSVE